MLLAAGRGERMRPLTDSCPKPLLQVGGFPLLHYPLSGLWNAGVSSVVINTGWLGDQIESAFGTSFKPATRTAVQAAPALQLHYSPEGRGVGEALETAGGIVRALPLLDDVFWVAAGDIYMPGFDFSAAVYDRFTSNPQLAHIWLVPNPTHNPQGDFGLSAEGLALNVANTRPAANPSRQTSRSLYTRAPGPGPGAVLQAQAPLYTFSTIAIYKRAFFQAGWCVIPSGNPHGVKAPLSPMLRAAMDRGLVSASMYEGLWVDVGAPERLALLNQNKPGFQTP